MSEVLPILNCSFCSRNRDQVRFLISGPLYICICDVCVAQCQTIIDEQIAAKKVTDGNQPADAERAVATVGAQAP